MTFRFTIKFIGLGRQLFLPTVKGLPQQITYYPTALSTVLLQKNSNRLFSTDEASKEAVVYQGPLSRQIRHVKLFSLMTSISGIFAQPVIMARAAELGSSTSTIILVCSVVGFFTFVTPLLLHYVTKKYVTSVLYNAKDDLYTATTYSLFLRRKELQMKPGDGILPDVAGLFTSVTVRGVPLFIDARYFTDVHHYKRIMGFDRPIDFKLKTDCSLPKKE